MVTHLSPVIRYHNHDVDPVSPRISSPCIRYWAGPSGYEVLQVYFMTQDYQISPGNWVRCGTVCVLWGNSCYVIYTLRTWLNLHYTTFCVLERNDPKCQGLDISTFASLYISNIDIRTYGLQHTFVIVTYRGWAKNSWRFFKWSNIRQSGWKKLLRLRGTIYTYVHDNSSKSSMF